MNGVQALIGRVLGEKYISRFEILITTLEEKHDFFKISSNEGRIRIQASSSLAASSGVYWYMKHCLKLHVSWCGSQLNIPDNWPKIEEEITKKTPYAYKYYFNYCTYGYSMAFWEWERWEQELDWMAMNGINLVLSLVGHEEVWRQTLIELGYKNEEAKAFICGPAFLPWQWMQNIQEWGSDYRDDWFERRVKLAKKIHERMKELGISPAMQGYSGMIPKNFKERFREADIREQGTWNFLNRPDLLVPGSIIFNKVADIFYKKQKEIFQVESTFYCTDPFHEGGSKETLDIKKCMKHIQEKMIEHDKEAIWIMQAWGNNPDEQTLEVLDNKHTIILDLWCEANPTWKKKEAFRGIPWIWCILGNFGGKNGLYGNLEETSCGHINAYHDLEGGNMVGVGLTMEGIDNNPVVWELLCDSSWEEQPIALENWLDEYILRRYGRKSERAKKAWEILKESIYNCKIKQEGGVESIICARPGLMIDSVSTWGPKKYYYDHQEIAKACRLLAEDYEILKGSQAYLYDLVDVTRQALADRAKDYYYKMIQSFETNQLEEFEYRSKVFLEIIEDMDALLGTHSGFLLGNYLEQAKCLGITEEEKVYLEWNARTLITVWGDKAASDALRDYSHRQWAGLTKDFYYKRWEIYIKELKRALSQNREVRTIDWYEIEYEWTEEDKTYTTIPKGGILQNVRGIIEKYLKD